MAEALNRTSAGQEAGLAYDEKRLVRWETGEVLWPHAVYRRALHELTGRDAEDLGFVPPHRHSERLLIAEPSAPRDTLQAEADIFDTLELTRLAEVSDIGAGTIEALHETADLLCRAYPSTPAAVLRDRTKRRLQHVIRLLGGRSTLSQHRELLVAAGWLAVLLGCLHYDQGEREEAEAARQAAFQWARQAGHAELMGWAYEMSAWFALVDGRYEQLIEFGEAGQAAVAYSHSAFAYERRSLTALTSSAADLDAILQQHYQGEHLAREFHERHLHIRRALEARKISSLEPSSATAHASALPN